MTKEDWIILRLLKAHKIIDIHNLEDCTKASLYLKEKYEDFDPELKKVALSTFALSLFFWLTLIFLN